MCDIQPAVRHLIQDDNSSYKKRMETILFSKEYFNDNSVHKASVEVKY